LKIVACLRSRNVYCSFHRQNWYPFARHRWSLAFPNLWEPRWGHLVWKFVPLWHHTAAASLLLACLSAPVQAGNLCLHHCLLLLWTGCKYRLREHEALLVIFINCESIIFLVETNFDWKSLPKTPAWRAHKNKIISHNFPIAPLLKKDKLIWNDNLRLHMEPRWSIRFVFSTHDQWQQQGRICS